MSRFTVVYDACALYPAPLRDLLMRLAVTNLFKAHWTDRIHDEWTSAVLRSGKSTPEKLQRVRDLMDVHATDAKVTGFEHLIERLDLPDPDDRHVLAAAIRCHADAIVIFNSKDFPEVALEPYAIELIHPDDFVYYQLDMNPVVCCAAIKRQRLALQHPPLGIGNLEQLLDSVIPALRQALGKPRFARSGIHFPVWKQQDGSRPAPTAVRRKIWVWRTRCCGTLLEGLKPRASTQNPEGTATCSA